MPPIKPQAQITDKWQRRAAVAGPDYETGVRNPKAPWDAAAAAADNAWKGGVQAAVAAGSFVSGVRAAGQQTWQQASIEKGIPRFPQGVAVAAPKYERNFAPIRAIIEGVQLPPRGPRRSQANIQRATAMIQGIIAGTQRRA